MRMLDRLVGADPPKLIVVDPRQTEPAAHADVHLTVEPGRNVPLLNAILRELILTERIDRA
jgi:anaerobic selenocysteine-containing dehydrogenase